MSKLTTTTTHKVTELIFSHNFDFEDWSRATTHMCWVLGRLTYPLYHLPHVSGSFVENPALIRSMPRGPRGRESFFIGEGLSAVVGKAIRTLGSWCCWWSWSADVFIAELTDIQAPQWEVVWLGITHVFWLSDLTQQEPWILCVGIIFPKIRESASHFFQRTQPNYVLLRKIFWILLKSHEISDEISSVSSRLMRSH
jgi:hypothetical protein